MFKTELIWPPQLAQFVTGDSIVGPCGKRSRDNKVLDLIVAYWQFFSLNDQTVNVQKENMAEERKNQGT